MSSFDLILVRLTKVVGLILGAGIMVYETGWDHTDRPYLYAAALLMMGLQVAEIVDKVAHGLGSKGGNPADFKEDLSELARRRRAEVEQTTDAKDGTA